MLRRGFVLKSSLKDSFIVPHAEASQRAGISHSTKTTSNLALPRWTVRNRKVRVFVGFRV